MNVSTRKQQFHPFSSLGAGAVFNCDGDFYMATTTVIPTQERYPQDDVGARGIGGNKHIKCVRLKDGQLFHFPHETQVTVFPNAIMSPGREE